MSVEKEKLYSNTSSPEDLQFSEIDYRRFFEASCDGILIINALTQKIIDVNPFMIGFLGYTHEEFLGKELWEVGLLRNEKTSIAVFKELEEKNFIRYDDLPLKTKAGDYRKTGFTANVYSENDRLLIQCHIRDNSGHQPARNVEVLQKIIEDRFNLFMDTSPAIVWMKDENFRYIYMNPAWENASGLKKEEWLGKTDYDVALPEVAAMIRKNDLIGLLTGETMKVVEETGEISGQLYHWNTIKFPFRDASGQLLLGNIAIDMTTSQNAENALREGETKFKELVDASIIGVITTDLKGTVIEANDVFLKMLGYERDELLTGKVRLDEITPTKFHSEDERIETTEFGVTKPHMKVCTRKDGRLIPVLVGGTLLKDSNDTIIAFVLDLSEQKRVLEELSHLNLANERQARLFDSLLSSIADMTFTFDREQRFRYANKPVLDLYGKKLEELIGRNFADLEYPEELTLKIRQNIQQVFDTGESVTDETEFPNAAGEIGYFEYIFNPVVSVDGTVEFVVGSARDITERKKAGQLLQQAEANFRNLVESSPGIVYLNEPEPPFLNLYISPNIKAFGYSPEEWHIKPDMWSSIIYHEDRERVRHEFEAATKQGLETDLEYRILARNGTMYWWQDKGRFVFDEQGNKIGWQGIILDVTATKGLEQQLRQAQKLESVGLLAGGIAHDFNNMLTAINGYSELTLRRLPKNDPLCAYLEEIKKAGLHSADLTRQLLAFSRQQVLQPIVLDLSSVITDTIKMLQRLIGENIQLAAMLNPKVGRVKVDPGQFSQIIMNLAVNSRDAMPQGGRLTIETANVFLDSVYCRGHIGVLPGAYVMLAVSDTGTGMSEQTRQHIFEPFFTTKEVGKGTGLGLATVYGIVKQSGGNIEVYSEEDIGTTFKIYLPRVMEEVEMAELTNTSSEMSNGTETILLVEDEEMVRNLSREILTECGYTVITARNGLDALEIYDKGACKFDLLMTDVVMPQMGGRELAEKLTTKLPNLHVLFTSGYTDDAIVLHGVIETNTSFIQKPFTPASLAAKIRKVLDKSDK